MNKGYDAHTILSERVQELWDDIYVFLHERYRLGSIITYLMVKYNLPEVTVTKEEVEKLTINWYIANGYAEDTMFVKLEKRGDLDE